MRLTSSCEAGLRCLLVMARSEAGRPVSTRRMVTEQQLSRPFVEQVMLRLRRAGLVESTRGVQGGYRLVRSLDRISALDVVRALEDECLQLTCQRHVGRSEGCADSAFCAIRLLCLDLKAAMEQVLADATLARLLESSDARPGSADGPRSVAP